MKTKNNWINEAASFLGVAEIPGSANNPQILEFLASSIKTNTEETPWCAAFVNYILARVHLSGSRSAMARSFETSKNFIKLDEKTSGAIVTRYRGTKQSGFGHVGFAVCFKPGYVGFLAGNQGDKVSVSWHPEKYVTGYWWPKDVPIIRLTDEEKAYFASLANGDTKMS